MPFIEQEPHLADIGSPGTTAGASTVFSVSAGSQPSIKDPRTLPCSGPESWRVGQHLASDRARASSPVARRETKNTVGGEGDAWKRSLRALAYGGVWNPQNGVWDKDKEGNRSSD